MNGSILKTGIRTATAATSAALPHLSKAAIAAVDAGEAANAPERKSWFTRKTSTDAQPSLFTRKNKEPTPKVKNPSLFTRNKTETNSDTAPPATATPPAPATDKEEEDLSFFDQIKKDAKDGKFSDIMKSLPSPPPLPIGLIMEIVGSLNDIFKQNIGKVGQYTNIYIDSELEKKKNELELTKALGEHAKKTDLEKQMPIYIEHVLNQ